MAKRTWKRLHGGRLQRWSKSRVERGWSLTWLKSPPRSFRARYERPQRRRARRLLALGRWDEVEPARHRHSARWDWW